MPQKKREELIKRNSGFPLTKIIIIFSAVILILNCVFIVKRGIDSYHSEYAKGKRDANLLIRTLSDHIELTFLSADITLKRALERQYFNMLFGNNLLSDMKNHFSVWVNETPQISAMMMTDEHGNIQVIHRKNGFETWMQNTNNVKSKQFFHVHAISHDPDLLYIGKQKNHFITMSRRISKLNGDFGGVVTIAVNSDYISSFFQSVKAETKVEMVLMQKKNILIEQVKNKEEVEIFQQIAKNTNIPHVIKEWKFDTKLKIFSFKKINNDIIIGVITHGEDIFREWRINRIHDGMFMAVFTIFVLVLSFFATAVAKQMRRVQRSEGAAIVASQAKSDFLAHMSHELRTPLNAIIGFSEMLEAGYFGKLNSRQKERVHDVTYCGTHLLDLINDILEFSKGEAGRIDLHIEMVSISKIVRETVRIFSDRTSKDGVQIITNIPTGLPHIMADTRKVKQILLNLLSNAIEFTDNGTVTVTLSFQLNDGIEKLAIIVQDTGVGMAEEDIPKALSVFGQVNDDISHGGTGLGLPLCKMFAELHGGELIMQSEKGVGTTVSVILPKDRVL